jgi:hypothetical protein
MDVDFALWDQVAADHTEKVILYQTQLRTFSFSASV